MDVENDYQATIKRFTVFRLKNALERGVELVNYENGPTLELQPCERKHLGACRDGFRWLGTKAI